MAVQAQSQRSKESEALHPFSFLEYHKPDYQSDNLLQGKQKINKMYRKMEKT